MTDSTRPDSPSSGRATEWVMATGNRGKVLELQALFNALSVSLRLQSDFNVTPAEETGATFVENAILKARAAALQTGLPALADDSGLEVDALNGQPGVRSARYGEDGGFAAGDGGNNTRLLESLRNVPEAERGARFHCVLVFMRHAEDPVPLMAHGTWEGRILVEPTGDGGFGYDPLFFVADNGCSAAQLDGNLKNAISHRGQASRQLLSLLRGDLAL